MHLLLGLVAATFLLGVEAAEAQCLKARKDGNATASGTINRIWNGNYPGRKMYKLAGCNFEVLIDGPPRSCAKGQKMIAVGRLLTCDIWDEMDGECTRDEPDTFMTDSVKCG